MTWEDQIGLFEESKSYKLSNVTVRSFNGAKYLSLGEGCDIEEIEDIGEVIDDENAASQLGKAKVVKGEIVAVVSIDIYKGCRNCNAKMVDVNGPVGVCSKCNTKMKLARCTDHCVANVILEDQFGLPKSHTCKQLCRLAGWQPHTVPLHPQAQLRVNLNSKQHVCFGSILCV